MADKDPDAPDSMTIIAFSGDLDKLWPTFILSSTGAASGMDVTVTGIPTTDYPTPATRPLNSRLDCSMLETDFGIKRPDWQSSLSRVIGELS